VNVTVWSQGLEVSGDGTGIVSHAGIGLLRHLADKTGLTRGRIDPSRSRMIRSVPPAIGRAAGPFDARMASASASVAGRS